MTFLLTSSVFKMCSDMNSPEEYITLIIGEEDNFSEVFGYRCLCNWNIKYWL